MTTNTIDLAGFEGRRVPLTSDLLDDLGSTPEPFVPEEWHGKKICAMAVCYSGDLARTGQVLAPIRAIGDPIVDLLAEQPYTQVQSYLDDAESKGVGSGRADPAGVRGHGDV